MVWMRIRVVAMMVIRKYILLSETISQYITEHYRTLSMKILNDHMTHDSAGNTWMCSWQKPVSPQVQQSLAPSLKLQLITSNCLRLDFFYQFS